jgi:hypothetical protein
VCEFVRLGNLTVFITSLGVPNWAAAIFLSPSFAYSSHPAYAEQIVSPLDGKPLKWACLVKSLVKPGSFKEYDSTVVREALGLYMFYFYKQFIFSNDYYFYFHLLFSPAVN